MSDIKLSTFESYLKEMNVKYSSGMKIRSNKYPDLDGEALEGDMILEIPKSNQKLSNVQDYIDLASKNGITLRFSPE